MPTNPSIFKAYDVRGRYPVDLDETTAFSFGRALVLLLRSENPHKPITVGISHDMRLSGETLKEKLISGIIEQGGNVVDFGLCSTPTFYFGVAFNNYDGGVQVSASHNPKDDNGFKVVRAHSSPIGGETGLFKIRDLVLTGNFPESISKGAITEKLDVIDDIPALVLKEWPVDLKNIKPFKIVVDAANAMGAVDVAKIFENLPCELIKINFDLDGNFPSHQADPLDPKNLEILQKAVIENHADFGISPDGDGDRYFFVDDKGNIVPQEILRGLMAQDALRLYPGAKVCYDIRPGRITVDLINQAGGIPVLTRVGHSLIKAKMLEEDAVFGGESSGHYFYRLSIGTFEAPFILVWRFLSFISQQNKTLSAIVDPLKIYFSTGEINFTDIKDTAGKIKEIAQKYADGQISYLDGISVEYPDYWFNIRPSNTEPLLRLRLEARTPEIMAAKRDEIAALIQA